MTRNRWRPALKASFPHTLPILTGFLFLGMAYGILMRTRGFHPLFPTVMVMTIFGLLVVYCLRNTDVAAHFALPEMLAVSVTVLLHLWKRQMLLSIAGGTAVYMLLMQLIF